MKKILPILSFLSLTSVAFATSELYQNNEELKEALSNPYEPNWFSLIFGLCVVVGLIYLTGFIYQKLLKIKLNTQDITDKIQIVSSVPLGQGKNLYLIKVNDEYSLIGATQSNIVHIKDIKPMEKINEEDFCETKGESCK